MVQESCDLRRFRCQAQGTCVTFEVPDASLEIDEKLGTDWGSTASARAKSQMFLLKRGLAMVTPRERHAPHQGCATSRPTASTSGSR